MIVATLKRRKQLFSVTYHLGWGRIHRGISFQGPAWRWPGPLPWTTFWKRSWENPVLSLLLQGPSGALMEEPQEESFGLGITSARAAEAPAGLWAPPTRHSLVRGFLRYWAQVAVLGPPPCLAHAAPPSNCLGVLLLQGLCLLLHQPEGALYTHTSLVLT